MSIDTQNLHLDPAEGLCMRQSKDDFALKSKTLHIPVVHISLNLCRIDKIVFLDKI